MFCKSGGCSAKLGPAILEKVLANIPSHPDENLLVGYHHKDDASVYKLGDDIAMVQTLDFFPPMVDDPYTFGQIAAANALSDIFAMGGTVKTALNILCFPESMDINICGQILLGGAQKVQEAQGILSGGHSIYDKEVKYGLSVSGIVHPDHIYTNKGCVVKDKLILSKPLGVGLTLCAKQVGEASTSSLQEAITSMTTLNAYAAECMKKYEVHACTDVTGFGLLGHIYEMIEGDVSAILNMKQIPYIKEAYTYAEEFYLTAAAQRNRNYLQTFVHSENITFAESEILYDPQTSGGLLISVAAKDASALVQDIKQQGLPCACIGEIMEASQYPIYVKKE